MNLKSLIQQVDHRPWGLPDKNWKYYQEWNDVLFLHYQVDIKDLETRIPKELEIDLFDGKPWVTIVAFTMERIRFRYLPPFSPITTFPEINVRTYVKSNNKSGVYFLSIEGGKRISCFIAKAISELPYRFSRISRSDNTYQSYNSDYSDHLKIDFTRQGDVKEKTQLDIWLSERYALFQDSKTGINLFELHHEAWNLQHLHLNSITVNYPRFRKLVHDKPDKLHFSKGVNVIAWEKMKIFQ